MKRLLLLAALAFAVYASLSAMSVSAGCCCVPPLYTGFEVASAALCTPPNNFTVNSPNATHPTCNEVCNATFAPPIVVPPPAVSCDNPAFKPAPTGLMATAVKGKKHLRITWNALPCPAYAVNISRCKGAECTDYAQIAQLPSTVVYTDTDPALRWNTTYRYKVVATYVISGVSEPAIVTGNPGDIECWNQGFGQFCVSSFYYELFEQYLKSYGYGGTPASSFQGNFPSAVNQTFQARINKAWKCDAVNRLFRTTDMVNCPAGQQCVVDESVAKCVTPSPCASGSVFGLYASPAACEGTFLPVKNYCFFDRSRTSVDTCFTCNPRMSCADYRSRRACAADNCNAGECEWRDVLPDIGIGVCVDKRFSNCAWCTRNGTPGLENNDAYNEVFDRCTQEKSNALSVPNFTCTYNKNTQESLGCDATACMDYTTMACGSAVPPGITLNPDNSLATSSADACNIRVCQVIGNLGCVKNHDGNAAPDCPVAAVDRRACELDYFAPNTSLVPLANVPGRMDWLLVKMLDKFNATHDGALMEGKPGYKLRVCVVSPGTPCTNASTFAETNLSRLNFNDLSLQAGKTVLATMVAGANALRYYGIDNRSNPEVVKNMTIIACARCQGPKVLELSVAPGQFLNGKYYTISNIPVIMVSFNEPAMITTAALVSGTTVLPVTATPGSGTNYDYTFVPLNPLPDGTYTFTFNAKDANGLAMDAPGEAVIVVDTTPGVVTILPPDGTVINVTSVDISFEFTEPLSIVNATLEEEIWISPYAARKKRIDLAPLLTSKDNITYKANVIGLVGGKKNLRIHAEDFAGNPTIGRSSFWINTGPLQARMREPSWGVAGSYVFDVIIDTTRLADCRYVYDTPTAPPANVFEQFTAPFNSSTGVMHTITGFNKIKAPDLSKHKLHVYCKLGTNISVTSFDLSVDPTPPVIKSAFAQPAVIIERRVPGQDLFTTWIKVQTDDDGFCAYSTENVPFILMGGLFSGFDEVPKKSHDAEINVTEQNKTYTYYVACKNTAEKPSATVPVTFSVDLTVPFAASSKTPPYSNTTNFSLRVETNKRAFCYVGDVPEAVLTCMGACEYGYGHTHPVSVNSSGNKTWYVKCSTGASGEVSALTINVVVDTTPPVMLYVNDSSDLLEEPEFSYFLDRLMVRFLGTDNETAVNAYYYRLLSFFANITVLNWTLSTNTNGTAFWVSGLNLTNGNKYRFEVYPVNIVGLQGAPMSSDGVTIDITKAPEACQNGVKDGKESDLDCGGECAGCLDGASCNANTDCISGFCNSGMCAVATCDDGVKNGNETDTDCGGRVCLPCSNGKACVQGSDCASGSCNYGVCGDADPCSDGVLTGTETDIDCGGSCAAKCGEGKNCQSTADCSVGLLCLEGTCAAERDSDGDGTKDDVDKCPNTPPGEVADQDGCSPSQKFSCGDEISDGWRIRYFGSVRCDGDGAPNADPDKDGLANALEFRYRTDPTQPDTDFDGWDDKAEIDAGTDPLDPKSHPPSKLRILLWLLLILLILAVLAVGGYLGYQYYRERIAPPPAARPPAVPARPPRKLRVWPGIFEKLRAIARKEEPEIMDRDWVSLATLAERLQKGKVPIKEDTFARLKDIIKGKLPKKEMPEVLAAIRKEPKAFALLRRVAFEKLTPAEKERLRAQLALLRAGKLTPAEIEDILSKLRVTAAYYRAHRDEIERELEEWLKEGRRRK